MFCCIAVVLLLGVACGFDLCVYVLFWIMLFCVVIVFILTWFGCLTVIYSGCGLEVCACLLCLHCFACCF